MRHVEFGDGYFAKFLDNCQDCFATMQDNGTKTGETKAAAFVKYRSSALCSIQKEIAEIEKSVTESEEPYEDSNGGKPDAQMLSRWQRAFQLEESPTYSKWQLGNPSGLTNNYNADNAEDFRGGEWESGSGDETDNASPSASLISLRTSNERDSDSLSLSFSMNTAEFSSLTETERLEKQMEILEKRIEETEERIERKGRTKKQRQADRLGLQRMNSKLEKLQKRIQIEVSGGENWSLIRKEIRKPAFGLNTFSSVDFLRRKKALSEATENFPRRRAPRLTTIVEQAVAQNIEDKLREKRALLQGNRAKIEKEKDDSAWVKLGLRGARALDPAIQEEFNAQMKDEREFQEGWLRISDVREDFMKSIGFYPEENSRGKGISHRNLQWQKYADRDETLKNDASKFEILAPLGRPGSRNKCCRAQSGDAGRSCSSSARLRPNSRKLEEHLSSLPRVKKMVDYKKVLTTSFLPVIPSPDSKRRPATPDIEKVTDENDQRLMREKVRLIPNRRRVAENRARLFMAQMDFAKTHKLSSKKIVEGLTYAIEDYGLPLAKTLGEQLSTVSRQELFLIGALSKDHLRPLGKEKVHSKSG